MELPPPEPWTKWSYVQLALVALIVIVTITYGHAAGIRLAGLYGLAHTAVYLWQRKIPYGWQGRRASGHLTGGAAIVVGLMLAAISATMVAFPDLVAELWPRRK